MKLTFNAELVWIKKQHRKQKCKNIWDRQKGIWKKGQAKEEVSHQWACDSHSVDRRERGVIHKSSTWLHDCYILVLLWPQLSGKKKAQKYSHTHTSMYLYFLEQPVDLTRKAPETFLFRLHFKNAKTATSCAFNIFGIIYFTYKIIIKTEICKTGTTVGTTPPKLTH